MESSDDSISSLIATARKFAVESPESRSQLMDWLKDNYQNDSDADTWNTIFRAMCESEISQLRPLFGGNAKELKEKWACCFVTRCPLPMLFRNARGCFRATCREAPGVRMLAAHAALAGDFVFADYVLSTSVVPCDTFEVDLVDMLVNAAVLPGGEPLKRWMYFSFEDCDEKSDYPRLAEIFDDRNEHIDE